MDKIKLLFTWLFSSKKDGLKSKRNIGIIMILISLVAKQMGVELPGNAEEIVTTVLDWLGGSMATWGTIVNFIKGILASKKKK